MADAELERVTAAREPDRQGVALMPRWSADIIRKRAEHLAEVDAPDEQAAIKRAAEVFDIPPERQNRISVRRIGKGEKA